MPVEVMYNDRIGQRFIRNTETGHTHPASARAVESLYGAEFLALLSLLPNRWIEYNDGEDAERCESATAIVRLQPVTRKVRKLDPSAWPEASGL